MPRRMKRMDEAVVASVEEESSVEESSEVEASEEESSEEESSEEVSSEEESLVEALLVVSSAQLTCCAAIRMHTRPRRSTKEKRIVKLALT